MSWAVVLVSARTELIFAVAGRGPDCGPEVILYHHTSLLGVVVEGKAPFQDPSRHRDWSGIVRSSLWQGEESHWNNSPFSCTLCQYCFCYCSLSYFIAVSLKCSYLNPWSFTFCASSTFLLSIQLQGKHGRMGKRWRGARFGVISARALNWGIILSMKKFFLMSNLNLPDAVWGYERLSCTCAALCSGMCVQAHIYIPNFTSHPSLSPWKIHLQPTYLFVLHIDKPFGKVWIKCIFVLKILCRKVTPRHNCIQDSQC